MSDGGRDLAECISWGREEENDTTPHNCFLEGSLHKGWGPPAPSKGGNGKVPTEASGRTLQEGREGCFESK